jgi:ATP/maltotriose-dependent transcriptional regulator MalT
MRTAIDATGSNLAPSSALHLAAMRGREAELMALIEVSRADVTRRGEGSGVALTELAKSVLYNGLGRYDKARAAAEQIGPEDLTTENWGMVELIEAAARGGTSDVAADALRRLCEATEISGTDWGLGIRARCSALLSEGRHAEVLYREAIEHLARTGLRAELARAQLLYGEWLRREGRRVDAREQLRIAHAVFVTAGMEAFAERARVELLATGEKVRKRKVERVDDLTSQERQIARLARDGLSNPEIATRLFISPRTVEWHLRKVYSKLGISSRRGLYTALPAADQEALAT